MISDAKDQVRSCSRKVFCATEGAAYAYRKRLLEKGRRPHLGRRYELVVYRCRYCQGYHVGNQRRHGEA